MRTIPGISHMLKPLDDAIDIFIKVLLQGYAFNPTERVLFSLPAKYGGMELIIPSEICQEEYENSREITKESTNKIILNEIQSQDNRVYTAERLGNRRKEPKSKISGWIKARLNFALIRIMLLVFARNKNTLKL